MGAQRITPRVLPYPPLPHSTCVETCSGFCREMADWRIAEREAAIAEARGATTDLARIATALERIAKQLETFRHKNELVVMEMHPLAGTPEFEAGRRP